MIVVLASLAMIGPFTIDTIYPGFQRIGAEFSVGTIELQQITGVYIFTFALMSVMHGPISDAVGRKPVILVGLAGYVLASIGCAFAPNLGTLLFFRAIQGLCSGAASILCRVVIRDLYSGARAQQLMSQLMMLFALGPALAPIIGGWILYVGDWPWIFLFCAVFGGLLIAATMTFVPESLPPADRQPLALGALFSVFRRIGSNAQFLRLAGSLALTFGGYFIYIVSAPIVIHDLLGLGERDFWVLFVPMIGGMLIGSFISHQMAERMAAVQLTNLAMLGMIAAAVLNVVLNLGDLPLFYRVMGPLLLGVANGITMPMLQLFIIEDWPRNRGAAASLGMFVGLMFNSLLASVISPFISTSLLMMAVSCLAITCAGVILWGYARGAVTTSSAG